MKRILLFRIGGLGDLLVVLPSIHLLRKCFPSCWISLVCKEEYGKILEETGVIDECLSQDARNVTSFFSVSPSFGKELDQWLRDFDGIMGWMQRVNSLRTLESMSSVFSSRGMTVRLFIHDEHEKGSISRYFFRKTSEFLKPIGKIRPRFRECSRLPLSSIQKKKGLELMGEEHLGLEAKMVVFHPGSGSQDKCWPFHNFLEVVQRFHLRHVQGVLVTGPAEERVEREIRTSSLPENWVWLRHPSLLRLAGLLSAASFYLGNDSGISHLAAACGTKGLALFREDLKRAWKPYGRISVLSRASIEDISLETVWKMIRDQVLK